MGLIPAQVLSTVHQRVGTRDCQFVPGTTLAEPWGKAMWRGQEGKVSTEEDGLRDPSNCPTEISEQKPRMHIVPGEEKHVSSGGTAGNGEHNLFAAVPWT